MLQGVAGVHIVRKSRSDPPWWHFHNCPILFTFVTEGSMTLEAKGPSINYVHI